MSALGNAVLCVLVRASQDHVIDVAAGRVVAQVENGEGASGSLVSRDVTMCGFPCDPVGIPNFSGISDCSVSGFVELAALKDLTGALQEARAFLGFQFAVQSFLKCLVMVCHEIDPFELLERLAFGCRGLVEGTSFFHMLNLHPSSLVRMQALSSAEVRTTEMRLGMEYDLCFLPCERGRRQLAGPC